MEAIPDRLRVVAVDAGVGGAPGGLDATGRRLEAGYWSAAPTARLNLVVKLPWGLKPELIAGYEARIGFALREGEPPMPRSSLFVGFRVPLVADGAAR